MTEPGLDPAPCRACGAEKSDHSDDDGRDHDYEEEDFVESIERLTKERDEARAALRGAARLQEVLRTSNEHLLKSRDEARRVARVLALAIAGECEAAGLRLTSNAPDSIQIALAYPDTTKEDKT